MRGTRRKLVLGAIVALAAVAPISYSQNSTDEYEPPPEVDPYTRDDPARMKKAGYERLRRFSFGGPGGSTSTIQEGLGGRRILWVETAHFKIGSTLPEWRITGKGKYRDVVKNDLKELKKKLRGVKTTVTKLDPWLRLHLYALRAERQYAEFCRLAGVDDSSFPQKPGDLVDGEWMGDGPYLGVQEKFGILLFEKGTSVGRYFQNFAHTQADTSFFYFFSEPGMFVFSTAEEFAKKAEDPDSMMHADLVAALWRGFVLAYKSWYQDPPPWLEMGLGHHFARQINDRRLGLFGVDGFSYNDVDQWKWLERAHARAKNDYFLTTDDMFKLQSVDDMSFTDNIIAWSRVDYLLTLDHRKFAKFLGRMKGRENVTLIGDPCRYDCQVAALEEAYGLTPAQLDKGWQRYVVKNYPARQN